MTVRRAPRPHRPGRPTAVLGRGAAAAVATTMMLSACTVTEGGEAPSTSTTTATSTQTAGAGGGAASPGPGSPTTTEDGTSERRPTAPALSAEALSEVLLPIDAFPVGTVTDRTEQTFRGEPFTMYLNLNGFTPDGRCAEVLEQINSFEAPNSTGVSAHYETDLPNVSEAGEPTVQMLAVTTARAVDAMGVYGELPGACGTLESTQQQGATATFRPVGDLDAAALTITDAAGAEQTLVTGGASEGRHHVYAVVSQVDVEEAQAILEAQVERFTTAVGEAG